MSKQSQDRRFLYAEDLLRDGKYISPVVEIKEVIRPGSLKGGDGRAIDKWTVAFKGAEKKLILCTTNCSIIHFVVGDEPGEKWIGKSIKIQARIVEAFGEDTVAIRVVPPIGTTLRKSLIKRLGRPAVFGGGK